MILDGGKPSSAYDRLSTSASPSRLDDEPIMYAVNRSSVPHSDVLNDLGSSTSNLADQQSQWSFVCDLHTQDNIRKEMFGQQ